jgi:hypothetical protein
MPIAGAEITSRVRFTDALLAVLKTRKEKQTMGLFSTLMGKIFHAGANAEAPKDAAKGPGIPESRVQAANRQGVSVADARPGAYSSPAATGSNMPPASTVDVAATLDKMAASNKEKLDWKHSIVDLMKLVGMDSSLTARKELAKDLNYTGDTNDSATMNMWLHKQVMKKLSENGGKVPAELLS